MRAAIIDRPGEIRVGEVPDPKPGERQVVVKVGACGICGTDLHIADGHFPPTPYPIVPGHEFAGEIVELGADVGDRTLRVGDRVAIDPTLACGYCTPCRSGHGNLCANWGATGDTVDGAFAEYVAVPSANCHRMPDAMSWEQGALVEPLSCAVHGVRRIGVEAGERFLVVGAGTMGLLMQQLLQRAGARVAVVDRNTSRLGRATELGAHAVAGSIEELDGQFDAAADCTGAAPAIEGAFDSLRRGGRLLVFGVAPAEARVSLSPFRIYNDEITIVGSMAVLNSYGAALDLVATGAVNTDALLTDTLPLSRYPDALTLMRSGAGLKVQVLPGMSDA